MQFASNEYLTKKRWLHLLYN